jgi:hypothetical protein
MHRERGICSIPYVNALGIQGGMNAPNPEGHPWDHYGDSKRQRQRK